MAWAFSGPLVGAGIHPVGSWLSDKINSGSKVTQRTTIVSIAAVLGVAYFVVAARSAPQPEIYWWPFFGLFMILFITTGLGNGSVFRSVPYIFSPDKASPVSGWIAAIKYIPKIIKFLGYAPFDTSTLFVGERIVVYRGGSCISGRWPLRTACRNGYKAEVKSPFCEFRLARSIQ